MSLTYDALGRMVEQNRSGSYTELVYGPDGGKLALMNGQTVQKAFVPLPGKAAAVYNSTGLDHYRHPDWLGSSRFASTSARGMYFDVAYAPFGEPYAQSGTTDLSFTGQNQDTVGGGLTGLYDFLAREYSTQGRWPSPDPAGLTAVNPDNPQSWNRYAYVLNNPLNLIDPFGRDCAYLSDDGFSIESIDTNSNLAECGANGGFWVDGTITGFAFDPNSDWIGLSTNGQDWTILGPGGIQPCGPPPSGFGILVGGQASGAIGTWGAGGALSGSAAGGIFFNSRDIVNLGAQVSSGATGYWGSNVKGVPPQKDQPRVGGAYVGYGPAITFAFGAGSAKQLKGPFQNLNIDIGFGMGKASVQIANSGNISTLTFSGGPIPISWGLGFAVSYYTTTAEAVGTSRCP